MTKTWTTLASALASLAAAVTAFAGTANAGWRDYAYRHGAGYYIEKYVDPHVTQDNRYKGSKHDTWSGRYYNSKTGRWTGQTWDGTWSGKSTAAPRKAKTTPVVTAKPKKKTYAVAPASNALAPASAPAPVSASGPAPVSAPAGETATPSSTDATAAGNPETGAPAAAVGPQSSLATGAELYGPPAPRELALFAR